jgi:surface antigen
MKRRRALALLAAAAWCTGAAAQRGMGSLMKGTPEELFTEQDNALRLEALGKAAEAPPGDPVPWSNGATSHRGDVTVTRAFESQGRPCKELRLRNEAGNRKGESRVSACQVDGKWRLVGSSQLR